MQRLALFLLTAGLLFTGCDLLEPALDGDSSDPVQIDYSYVGDEALTLLLADGAFNASALQRFGFSPTGAVFTLSNAADGNDVLAFRRGIDGRLTAAGSYPTGGDGSGDGLNGTSNPMALALGNRYLLAVNGGSDELSLFRVDGTALTLAETVASGGPRPISVTVRGRWAYVLNAGREGEPGNVTGFRIGRGTLTLEPSTTRPLNDGAGSPSQIAFSPSGRHLVITDKPTNTITTYRVRGGGRVEDPVVNASNGQTAFGFDFDRAGRLLVSEAFGGAEDASAVSSYRLGGSGTVTTISESVPTTETAACWVETFGRYAYVTNTGSSSVTGYRILPNGSLERLDDDGVTVTTGDGSGPLDMDIALSYLYVHSNGTDRLSVYRIGEGGSLTSVPGAAVSGLPPTAVGVAAY